VTGAEKAATTRRIRRRAAKWRGFKAEALAKALANAATVEGAIAYAAEHGKSVADVRAAVVATLGQCWRNLASRKREVRLTPHMRRYHTEYALGEMAVIKTGQRMLVEIDALEPAEPERATLWL
jgi:hypothetical protein